MVVLILDSAPQSLRGELSKWMLEPKAGVFVGTPSAAVRDLLWEKACQDARDGGCTMLYSAANEQGFAIRTFGDTTREIVEWEGLFLVARPNAAPKPENQHLGAVDSSDWENKLYPEIWAKSPNRVDLAPGEGQYHPLICHMVDTSMVALRLWRYVLPTIVKQRICEQLQVASIDIGGQWIAFFAGLHDLGKATPPFASKWPGGWKTLLEKGYRTARSEENKAHGILTCHIVKMLLQQMGLPVGVALPVSRVIGGHHGIFPSAVELRYPERYCGDQKWLKAQVNLAMVLKHILCLDHLAPPTGSLQQCNSFFVILAGLTSVADWIASDHHLFPFVGDNIHLPEYPRRARWLAWKALYRLGWLHQPLNMEVASFQGLFDKVPNRLQEQVLSVAPKLSGPSLVLLEYPMGGGKTEAALYLSDYLCSSSTQRGLYFALPTMATSNQMFGRVATYLRNRFSDTAVNVQLLHGHASLNAEFEVLKRSGEGLLQPASIYGGKASGLLAAEWFTYKKRGLLAPFGIGTIDQALLAVLQTKHFFVRLFGLAGRVVIFDEVHAYDTYMQALLCRLLTWLGACGTSVILLSATLPNHTRQALLSAYATGIGLPGANLQNTAYPRISWLSSSGSGASHIDGAENRVVQLQHECQDGNTWVERLVTTLSDGGCAAVIVNTVARAQAVYRLLSEHFTTDELILFHARFPFDVRMAIEGQVLKLFGPTKAERPHRCVVVATQVIEQSLDLDFDLMVSDLAPIDLLLQRSGRLWRHSRPNRPTQSDKPTMWVLMPAEDENGLPVFDAGSQAVYELHALFRTWIVLRQMKHFNVPDGVEEMIEAVYNTGEPPRDLPVPLRDFWNQTWAKYQSSEQHDIGEAQRRYIPEIDSDFLSIPFEPRDEEDETLHRSHQALTRLGGPSVNIICLLSHDGKLWTLGEQRINIRLEKQPDKNDVRALLGCSLSISFAPWLVKRLLSLEVPSTWQQSAYLRRYRLLEFNIDGVCRNADLPLRLDSNLGLVYIGSESEQTVEEGGE